MKDIRELINKFEINKQSENNIKYNSISIQDTLDIIDLNKTRSIESESSSSSTPIGRTSSEASPPNISVIGVSMDAPRKKHPERRSIRVSITKSDGTNNRYSCKLAHYSRKRELTANLTPELKCWWGYDDALEFISNLPDKQGAYIGKLKNTTQYKFGTPINMPIVAKTAVVLWADDEGAHVMLWLGDSQYSVYLDPEGLSKKQKQFYVATGYWRNTDTFVEEF